MRGGVLRYLVIVLGVVLSVSVVSAQTDCPALVERALTALGNNCGDLDRNNACYGYDQVSAEFFEPQPDDFFAAPADRAALVQVQRIETAALDEALDRWGIATMSVQANIPNTLPGQAVTFLLLGDVQLDNAVAPEDALPPVDPIPVTARASATLHADPDLSSGVVSTIDEGTVLSADAVSEDGLWLRLTLHSDYVWALAGVFDKDNAAASALPTVSEGSGSPMQAFYFTSGIGSTTCTDAPSTVAIRSPEGLRVDLSVNGADISLGSLVTLLSSTPGVVTMTVHEGTLTLEDGTVVEVGQSVDAILDAFGNITGFSAPRPATPSELALADVVSRAFAALSGTETQVVSEDTVRVVGPGDNLFRIALEFDTSVGCIMNANGLTDPTVIFVGQQLTIPDSCIGIAGPVLDVPISQPPPGFTVIEEDDEEEPAFLCAGLRPTSPTDGFSYGRTTFYWDGPAQPFGDPFYQFLVNIYDFNGGLITSVSTPGNVTNATLDMEPILLNHAQRFIRGVRWEVMVVVGNEIVCRAGANGDALLTMDIVNSPFDPARSQSADNDDGGSGFCGDNFCDNGIGEDYYTCPADCGCC